MEEDDGVDRSRIVIGGFSQGAAISTYTGLKNQNIGGILCLSGYLPLIEEFTQDELQNIQVPLLCCHGTGISFFLKLLEDDVVSFKNSKEKFKLYKGKKVIWKEYPMGHSACIQEIDEVTKFLEEIFKEKSNL